MTQGEFDEILKASRPIPVTYLSGGTPQENANSAWRALGKKKGFVWHTAQPIPGKGQKFFTAECVATTAEPTKTEKH